MEIILGSKNRQDYISNACAHPLLKWDLCNYHINSQAHFQLKIPNVVCWLPNQYLQDVLLLPDPWWEQIRLLCPKNKCDLYLHQWSKQAKICFTILTDVVVKKMQSLRVNSFISDHWDGILFYNKYFFLLQKFAKYVKWDGLSVKVKLSSYF